MPFASSLSSASPIVINTRPVERAAPLTEYLQSAGLTVVAMPMLALQPLPTTASDRRIMQRWLEGDYQALVIVSPTAAASGLAIWQELEQEAQASKSPNNKPAASGSTISSTSTTSHTKKPPSHLIAVGEATAAVLQQVGYQVRQPAVANNEGMLAMSEIKSLQAGDKLLVWRGLGGRRLLVNTLQARGVHIDSIAWYERTLPIDASRHYKQWLEQYQYRLATADLSLPKQKPIVIISSGTAFEHWADIVNQTPLALLDSAKSQLPLQLTDYSYIVLGERLAMMVADQNLNYRQVEDLAPATILAAIKDIHL